MIVTHPRWATRVTKRSGVATGPLNGFTLGPGAFNSSTGGTTGFVNVSYTVGPGDVGVSLFLEVANVGDTAFQSAVAPAITSSRHARRIHRLRLFLSADGTVN